MSFKKIHFRFDRIFIKGAKFDCLKTFTFDDLSRKLIKTKDKRVEYSRFSSNKYRKTIEWNVLLAYLLFISLEAMSTIDSLAIEVSKAAIETDE